MKPIVAGVLASIAALGLLTACGDDAKVTVPTNNTDDSIPQALIDQMIAQFEAAGMTVDKECFTKLLSDESLRNLVAAGGAPSQEAMQKFFACIKT
jgi:ABC-type glycerol-3-phosphate transport system substrate-binding protein